MRDFAPLISILTAAIAALSALSGVFLSNVLGRRERAAERTIKSRQEAQAQLLERGEELFLHLGKLDQYVADHVHIIEGFCHGHIDRAAFRSSRAELMEDFDGLELARIHLSVSVFFPELLPLYLESISNIKALHTLDGVLAGSGDLSAPVIYRVSADAVRLRKLTRANWEQLRDEISGILREAFEMRHNSTLPVV